jgi:tetratricopeptide (TPR) repeat protein
VAGDGGGFASFGLRYQYFATADHFLQQLTERDGDVRGLVLTVEPTRFEQVSEGDPDEVVDYAISGEGSPATDSVQVKASRQPSARNPLKPSTVTAIFAKMPGDPTSKTVLTNKPLSKRLRERCGPPASTTASQDTYELRSGQNLLGRIVHDKRTIDDVKLSVLQRIRTLRADHALGAGVRSAGLLRSQLIDRIFDSAAGMSTRAIPAAEVLELLHANENEVGHALRGYDWGLPLLEVPRVVSAVPRTDELATLIEVFDASVAGRAPALAVLSGVTGFGKSTIAADFCQLNRHLYEEVIWIDCREDGLVTAKARDTLAKMGQPADEDGDVATLFRTAIATVAGPFVLVFDGAKDRQQIEAFVPTSGCGMTIITSTNSTTWWTAAHRMDIDAFSQDQAIVCFASYANVDATVHHAAIAEIVARLERVPLAVAMAGLYFRDSGSDIAYLSVAYFKELAALDDPAWKPEGFDHTAFAAIRLAVAKLRDAPAGSDEDRRHAQALIHHSALLAPELIPFNMILQTVDTQSSFDLAHPPRPDVADPHRRNVIMTNLNTQTIARRRHYVDRTGVDNPASDTLNLHPLVHEILHKIVVDTTAPADLLRLLTDLMGTVYGWLDEMRNEGFFFPVDQLLVHADTVLNVADVLDDVDPDADADHLLLYHCATAFLRCEAANAYSSRGQYERSVSLIERVLNDVEDLALSPRGQTIITKAAADAIADTHMGELGVERALVLAERALQELRQLEVADQPNNGELTYLCGRAAADALQRFDTAETEQYRGDFEDIAARQQRSPSLTGMMQVINAANKSGRHRSALQVIDVARRAFPAAPNQLFLDHQAATAYLGLNEHREAAAAIGRVLDAETGEHLAYPFRSIYIALNTSLERAEPQWRRGRSSRHLSQLHVEIRRRLQR